MSWFQQLKQVFSGRREPRAERRSKPPAAGQPTDEAIAAIPDVAQRAAAHYNRAIAYQNEENDLDKAIVHYGEMLKLVPMFVKAYVNRGVCYVSHAKPEYELAVADFDRACALLAAGPNRAMAGYANRANAHELAGDLECALEDYTRSAAMAPAFDVAREGLERVRAKISARATPPERPSRSKRSAASFCVEGWRRNREGDPLGALAAFHNAVDLSPHQDALYGRGVVNCVLHRYPEAIADLSLALDRHPRFPAALTERGLAYVNSGDVAKGMRDYEAALRIDPSYPLAHCNKGSALCLEDRWAEAILSLSLALKLDPTNAEPYYNRSAAYEMLGELRPAVTDLEAYLRRVSTGPGVSHAKARLQKLRVRVGSETAEPTLASPETWTEFVSIGPDQTVAELVREVHAHGAFFVVMELGEGRRAVAPVYGPTGLRRRLTEIADHIGEHLLSLRLEQLHDLWTACVPVEPTMDRELVWKRVFESGGYTLVQEADRIVGVLSHKMTYDYPQLPTAIFGPEPVFERRAQDDDVRRCPACSAAIAYFEPTLRGGLLEDYACGQCGQSPVLRWVERRMRPNAWSQHGFLGEDDRLDDRVAGDDRTLQRLGVSHAQIADALGRLLDEASTAYEDRVAEATVRFEDNLRASGQRGVESEAILPLAPSLDEVEERVRRGTLPSPEEGASVGRLQVFLQVHLGYQACPWTILHRPWSEEAPPIPIVLRRVGNIFHETAKTGCHMPCRAGLTYRHSERDFLILHRDTGQYLRGSGLLVHLIRDHHFFEGEQCRYRLDPERAARVLGLLGAER